MKSFSVLVLFCVVGLAQEAKPTFEIASVRPNTAGGRGVQISMGEADGGRFKATNVSLRQLISIAYKFPLNDIAGGPGWINTDRFDIEAKPEEGFMPTPEQSQQMLQALLEERFGLKVEHQTKNGPIYALVVAKGGPKGKLKLSADQTPVPERPQGRGGRGGFGPGGGPDGGGPGGGGFAGGGGPRGGAGGGRGGGFGGGAGGGRGGGFAGGPGGGGPGGQPAGGAQPAAGQPGAPGQPAVAGQPGEGGRPGPGGGPARFLNRPLQRGQLMMGPGILRGSAVKIEQMVRPMTNQLGRPVVDRTKLEGLYDVEMTFTPTQLQGGPGGAGNPFPGSDGPTIFTAIQEQLGLKLESATGPIDSLIVQKVEKPGEN